MKILLTFSVDSTEIDKTELLGYKIFQFGDVYLKYEISISDLVKYSHRQKYLSKEISLLNENIIITGNPCYDINDVSNLVKELKKYNLSLDTIYIPSEERINARVQKAIEEQRKWGYRDGFSDEEIERNFENFRATLQKIREGLIDTNIKVIEV